MPISTLDQLIAHVGITGRTPETVRRVAQAALLALTPPERKALRAQMKIPSSEEKEEPLRRLARILARKK